MLIKKQKEFRAGYNPITSVGSADDPDFMEFGIIVLAKGMDYTDASGRERVLLLIEGEVEFAFDGKREIAKRASFLDENPICLHLPLSMQITVSAQQKSELAMLSVPNEKSFAARLYGKQECRTDAYGKGIIKEQSLRYVRTVFEDSSAPHSNLAIGEVVNFPGRWSSYPPHHHRQPEIYYYRISPPQGFALGCEGDEAYVLHDGDTLAIRGDAVHPHAAAPGYALYYVWAIPHTPARWKGERQSFDKDAWLLEKDAVIWPDR